MSFIIVSYLPLVNSKFVQCAFLSHQTYRRNGLELPDKVGALRNAGLQDPEQFREPISVEH